MVNIRIWLYPLHTDYCSRIAKNFILNPVVLGLTLSNILKKNVCLSNTLNSSTICILQIIRANHVLKLVKKLKTFSNYIWTQDNFVIIWDGGMFVQN